MCDYNRERLITLFVYVFLTTIKNLSVEFYSGYGIKSQERSRAKIADRVFFDKAINKVLPTMSERGKREETPVRHTF